MIRVLALPSILFVLGLGLAFANVDAPRMDSQTWDAGVPDGDSAAYFAAYEHHRTAGSRRFDLGVGLASLGGGLLVLLVVSRAWTWDALRRLQTPRARWVVVVAANMFWAAAVCAAELQLMQQFQRREFSPWADSMGIPVVGILIAGVAVGVLLNLGLFTCLWRRALPVSLWARPASAWSWTMNVALALVALGTLAYLLGAVSAGDPYSPPALVGLLAAAAVTRAAVCGPSVKRAC